MSHSEYWDGDPTSVIAFRKAERLRQDKLNHQLWLQGMYIYEAFCDASPLLHAFGKKGTKAVPYSSKPYDLHPEETRRREKRKEKRQKEKKVHDKGLASMMAFMSAFNKSRKTGGDSNA